MEIAGEHKEQVNGFAELTVVLAVSVLLIYIALVVQFKNAVKPLLVFAAIPYGMVGAFASLWPMDAPFGFMAFLGVVSLVGVIVSHIIVLFDFIEERREHGAPLEEALLEQASTFAARDDHRCRHGAGTCSRWRATAVRCGSRVLRADRRTEHATFITLGLVPVLYAIAVKDLKWISWSNSAAEESPVTSHVPQEA